MAVTADYSIVPYDPGRQTLGPLERLYSNPPPASQARAEGPRDGRPDPPLSGRPAPSSRPYATYSSLREIQAHRPAPTGSVIDIFV